MSGMRSVRAESFQQNRVELLDVFEERNVPRIVDHSQLGIWNEFLQLLVRRAPTEWPIKMACSM